MRKTDNYALAQKRAAEYFLSFSQEELIRFWKLCYDGEWIYLRFLCRDYRICRRTGSIRHGDDGTDVSYEEALSIYDLLCHEGKYKFTTGRYAPVNSLGIRYVGVDTEFYREAAGYFDRNYDAFCTSCCHLGGQELPLGDAGFFFPIFGDLKVQMKFYRADEEFPAALTLLWDENTLQFVHYETVFYMAGVLLTMIRQELEAAHGRERR